MGARVGVFPSAFATGPCRCFSDDNSKLTVGTRVGVFQARLQRPVSYRSVMI